MPPEQHLQHANAVQAQRLAAALPLLVIVPFGDRLQQAIDPMDDRSGSFAEIYTAGAFEHVLRGPRSVTPGCTSGCVARSAAGTYFGSLKSGSTAGKKRRVGVA